MESISLKVNGKINLILDIRGVFDDGYHSLDMLEASVDIYDIVKVSKSDCVEVFMDNKIQDETNTATKAAQLLKQAYGYSVKVEIEKHIPMNAGLGGSSADAAGVFFAYGKLYGIKLEDMTKLALQIGSDVPYMLKGGLAKVKCRGEIVIPDHREINLNLVVAQKEYGASTKDVYKEFDNHEKQIEHICVSEELVLYNVLSHPAQVCAPGIVKAKQDLLKFTDKVLMTGAGSAFIGIFESFEKAQECVKKLSDYKFAKAVKLLPSGIEIISEE